MSDNMQSRHSPGAAKPENLPTGGASSIDPVEFAFFTEVGIIEQLARNRFEQVMTDGLSLAQFSLLNHFVRLGGQWNLVRLAKAFQVSKPAMTNIVSKLHQKDFVTIKPDPEDGRGKLVGITLAGQTARNRALAQLAPFISKFREQFDPETLNHALPILQSVRQWLDENR